MSPHFTQPWISAEKIENLVQVEPILVIIGLIFAAAVIYKVLLREVSVERHKNLRGLFKNISLFIFFSASFRSWVITSSLTFSMATISPP